jgi:hypothetical protein
MRHSTTVSVPRARRVKTKWLLSSLLPFHLIHSQIGQAAWHNGCLSGLIMPTRKPANNGPPCFEESEPIQGSVQVSQPAASQEPASQLASHQAWWKRSLAVPKLNRR